MFYLLPERTMYCQENDKEILMGFPMWSLTKRIETKVITITDVSQWKLSRDREQVSKENVSRFSILKP